MSSLKIKELDPIEHILKRPDTYVGSIRSKKGEEYVASVSEDKITIQKEEIVFAPAMLRIFVEALSNAIDNVQRSTAANVACSKIKVSINMETGETSVWNDGLVIPIEMNDTSDVYKHTLVFGKLRTSTNFDDDEERTVSGRNGLGIKLTNVFSSYFKVKAVDPNSGKMFTQEWKNNMKEVSKPKITSSAKSGYTEVSWIPDFKHFNMTGYTEDIVKLYSRYVLDAAMLTKVHVYLNDTKLPIKNLQDYSKLFSSPTDDMLYIKGKDSEVLLSTADDFEAISFVNGVFTMHGGKHVDGWSEAVFRPIVDHLNKPKRPQVNIKDVKQFYRLFVVSTLVNPEFSSQSKTELTSPDVQASVEKKHINALLKWDTINKLNDIIRSKELLVMKKSERKKKGYTIIEGYDEANEAGGKHSTQCTLALCEGLSAKTFAVKGMDSPLFGKSGRDWIGVYALRGKILNVRSANPKSIADNHVITSIIQALGLRYGVDYTVDENFEQLNYGHMCILTDADTDGKHIGGLLLNFIHHLFPTLLQRKEPFIVDMMTPIAKFSIKGQKDLEFYDLNRADAFYKQNASAGIKVKYYKGLGTHSDEEIQEVFGKRVISYVKDEHADYSISKAFNPKSADLRKDWLEEYDPNTHTEIDENTLQKNITTFIDEDLITFSVDDCKRSIPNIIDGLKQSQRKILYAAFLKNLKKSFKVAQFSGYVAEKTNYHHGEQNLYETITKMAQAFVGSNNIPLFVRDGQFGSRLENGKDAAAARYIFTRLENITRRIFREEDDVLMDRIIDDGDIVEPKFYAPIIPMILVNGCEGIGTGWSSSIPAYNPIDIINCVKIWINEEKVKNTNTNIVFSSLPEITPWYRGFKGEIKEIEYGKFITYGICDRSDDMKDRVVVNEVPIGMSIQSFSDKLKEMVGKDHILKGVRDMSNADNAMFIIDEYSDGLRCNVENLKLFSRLSTKNMVLFNEDGKIQRYNNVEEIIESFCTVRLKYYVLRKEYLLKELEMKIRMLKNKKRFLEEVMDGKLIIQKKKEEVIMKELEQQGYDKENGNVDDEEDNVKGYNYLLRMPIRTFSDEKIEELNSNIVKIQSEIDKLTKTTEKQMWLSDLDELEKEYTTWLDDITKSQQKMKKKSCKEEISRKKKKKI
jgi:DNA topoisomerase-2